jgi:hypothetical protein
MKARDMIKLLYDADRNDYEVRDQQEKIRGFIWQSSDYWLVRVDEMTAQKCDTKEAATALAESLLIESNLGGYRWMASVRP